jgi:glycosyltransferase involved in cell wall biosynthesis
MYPQLQPEVVYCPVAPPLRRDAEPDAKATRVALQTPEDATVIVQVSRMESWKGHALHLDALALLKDVGDWVGWFVGGAQSTSEAHYEDELKKRAQQLGLAGRVRFLGQRSNVASLLAAADIFCQPNLGPEPFGIAFIEALYARLAVIATALGGAREIVNDACGVLVPPGDAQKLAASLRRLIEDRTLRLRLGSAGPARARELCDPATRMKQFCEALTLVVREKQVNG